MTAGTTVLTPDVVVVGAGPAGLTAPRELAVRGVPAVLVLDREAEAGGIPRHSVHSGYGIRDLRRIMTGPAYATVLAERARRAGAVVRTQAMVTGWAGDTSLQVTSPDGLWRVDARAVVLATGARERPRAARRVAGDRPQGVLTTGHLQNLVHLHHAPVGERAVVVGSELVSWSAVMTLREAGCRTVLMTSEHAQPESYLAFTVPGRLALRVPIATRTRVCRIIGKQRVQAVEVENLDTGARREVSCDTVVFTGDWIPDHELARMAGLTIDPGTRGPLVDTALRTSQPGVFAAGNLVHPVDTADVAALDGRHVADQVAAWLTDRSAPDAGVRLTASPPFRWVAPGLLRHGDPPPPRRRLLLWTETHLRTPTIAVRQAGVVIAQRRSRWPATPGRVFRVPASLLDAVDPADGPVDIGVA